MGKKKEGSLDRIQCGVVQEGMFLFMLFMMVMLKIRLEVVPIGDTTGVDR